MIFFRKSFFVQMCGICGVYGLEDKNLIRRMTDVVKYRGPDDSGYYIDKDIMLGHRRLSIIDLKTGKQPIFNEDKSCCIIFNGEIYNFKELRAKLELHGHRFSTNTDTEVILHSYEEYGYKCLKYLNGMFAFAIWDSNKKQLFIARDKTGIKPLFYTLIGNKFFFASEIKSILQYHEIKREIDKIGLHYFVNLRYIPKESTIFNGIKKLLPGHYLVYDGKNLSIEKYWDLRIKIEEKPLDYFVKSMRFALENSIKRQLVSDVPVASYLSGGIDSSTIVAIASNYKENLQTFSLGFNEPNDELNSARIVAERFGTEHKEFIVEFDVLQTIPETIWHIDMPKRNMWPYFIAKEIGKHVKVVLSGLGGDEVFGGYVQRYNYIHRAERLRSKISNEDIVMADKGIREIISKGEIEKDVLELAKIKHINNPAEVYTLVTHHNKIYSDFEYLRLLYNDELFNQSIPNISGVFEPYFRGNKSVLDKVFLAEFNTKLPDDFLLVEDACSMAHSLESRVPFLDDEVIKIGFKIPSIYKVNNSDGKLVLKKAISDLLPKEIISKKKAGFVPNVMTWYRNEFRDFALEIFPKSKCVKKYFNMNFIMKILNRRIEERFATYYNLIWDLICLEVWNEIYIENDELFKPELNIERLF